MSDLTSAIAVIRRSVVALLRIRLSAPDGGGDGKGLPARFEASLGGSAFCIVADRYLVTAFHVLNGGLARQAGDRFYAFLVPDNGDAAVHFPVIGVPLERPDLDIAVLEIGPSVSGAHIPAIPVSFEPQPDGARVVTVGYPSPAIGALNVDVTGQYRGGEFFLKSHANEGIVSSQYNVGGVRLYELNVGWHHGESGGPIATEGRAPAVFSLMQHYRNIQSPHGMVAGPHRGCALSTVRTELVELGSTPAPLI